MRDTQKEAGTGRERRRLPSGSPMGDSTLGSCPKPKADAQPLSRPSAPPIVFIVHNPTGRSRLFSPRHISLDPMEGGWLYLDSVPLTSCCVQKMGTKIDQAWVMAYFLCLRQAWHHVYQSHGGWQRTGQPHEGQNVRQADPLYPHKDFRIFHSQTELSLFPLWDCWLFYLRTLPEISLCLEITSNNFSRFESSHSTLGCIGTALFIWGHLPEKPNH